MCHVQMGTRNLNKIIDINYYPVETARRSNMRHRPIGLGVQGLADTFLLLGMPFDSPEAAELNSQIHETIYFAALKASCELAAVEGPYETYQGSPVSRGILQPDMWNVKTTGVGGRCVTAVACAASTCSSGPVTSTLRMLSACTRPCFRHSCVHSCGALMPTHTHGAGNLQLSGPGMRL